MAELLTKEIAIEYQERSAALPDYKKQDIKERRELRIELQKRCNLTELQALNIINGSQVTDTIKICERKQWEDEFSRKYRDKINSGMGTVCK